MCLIRAAERRSIKRVFLFTPQPRNSPASLSGGSDCSPSRCIHCHWDRSGGSSVSSCVIVFSACVCMSALRYLWMENFYQLGSLSHHSGSVSPSFRRGWWHLHTKLLLISTAERRAEKERAYCLFWLVMLPCFETLDAIKLFVLNCPVNGILSFLRAEFIIFSLFISRHKPLYNT